MRRLRISEHTEATVMKWKAGAAPEDRQLVEDLLEAIENLSSKKGRFNWKIDATDRTITVFNLPRGLRVLVRLWTDDPPSNPDQYDVVAIGYVDD
ncbi:hypothetical protein [Streptosporangium longisporum]|uniref:Uncharacterized protein n=1 Tax=Streptosporangium longisporum TaxID=46187 RepID=A0ABP6LF82_9ACTN